MKQNPNKSENERRITLRDHFAGLAMQGMMQGVNEPDCEWIARHSYDMADEMLERRKNRKPRE